MPSLTALVAIFSLWSCKLNIFVNGVEIVMSTMAVPTVIVLCGNIWSEG